MYMTEGMFGVDWVTDRSVGYISEIASELNMTEEEAYRYWTPSVIYRKIARALPYSEAFSINRDGTIKIVIYKKTQHDVNHLLNKYCYELDSEEPFEDRNNEPVVILKYKLIIKDIEEHSI